MQFEVLEQAVRDCMMAQTQAKFYKYRGVVTDDEPAQTFDVPILSARSLVPTVACKNLPTKM